MITHASVPGKIILSGEYAVVFGYPGIAFPSPHHQVEVTFEEQADTQDLEITWEAEVTLPQDGETYVRNIVAFVEKFSKKTFRGKLTIGGNLPIGKGMGSSTALIIAITRALLGDDCRAIAEKIETKLYPQRSGIDFAVIWSNAPIMFKKEEELLPCSLPADLLDGAELIDTGTPNETTKELVEWVTQESQSGSARTSDVQKALEQIGKCTDRILAGEDLKTVIRDHHRAQVQLGVVPEHVQKLIADIESKGGAAKVIGAGARTGGGGMVLVVK